MIDSVSSQVSRPLIGRWTTDRYLRLSRWWLVGGAALTMASTAFSWFPGSALLWQLPLFFLLGVSVAREHGQTVEGIALGVIVGSVLGFADGLVGLVVEPSILAAINIVASTLLTALIAGLLTTLAVFVSKNFFTNNS